MWLDFFLPGSGCDASSTRITTGMGLPFLPTSKPAPLSKGCQSIRSTHTPQVTGFTWEDAAADTLVCPTNPLLISLPQNVTQPNPKEAVFRRCELTIESKWWEMHEVHCKWMLTVPNPDSLYYAVYILTSAYDDSGLPPTPENCLCPDRSIQTLVWNDVGGDIPKLYLDCTWQHKHWAYILDSSKYW